VPFVPKQEPIQAWGRAGIVCWLLQEAIGALVAVAEELATWLVARRQARR
jgi:hypothetical protein